MAESEIIMGPDECGFNLAAEPPFRSFKKFNEEYIQPPPVQHDITDISTSINGLEKGDYRWSFLGRLARSVWNFYAELEPDHFRRIGRSLHHVATHGNIKRNTRLKACQAAMKIVRDAIGLMKDLQRADQAKAMLHLESLVVAFFDGLNEQSFSKIGKSMAEMEKDSFTALDRLRYVNAMWDDLNKSLRMLIDAQAVDSERSIREVSCEEVEAVEKDYERMRALNAMNKGFLGPTEFRE